MHTKELINLNFFLKCGPSFDVPRRHKEMELINKLTIKHSRVYTWGQTGWLVVWACILGGP